MTNELVLATARLAAEFMTDLKTVEAKGFQGVSKEQFDEEFKKSAEYPLNVLERVQSFNAASHCMNAYYPRLGYTVVMNHHSERLSTILLAEQDSKAQTILVDRVPARQLISIYKKLGFRKNRPIPIGPFWHAVEGVKPK